MRSILRLELSTQIIIGLAVGIACGILFGELCEPLSIFRGGSVDLLRMTVLP